MLRLERKNRTDIIFEEEMSIFDAIDNAVKATWRINDEEYDYLLEKEGEKYLLIDKENSFTEVKEAINFINLHLSNFYKSKNLE